MSDAHGFLLGQRNYVLQVQKSLVSRPALGPDNGGDGEMDKAEYVLSCLEDIGMDRILRLDAPDSRVTAGKRPNLAAFIQGRDTGRTMWIISHLDVVPAGDVDTWESDPFTLRVDGDLIYGRGVEDNHQAVVSSLLCAKAVRSLGLRPEMNLGLLFVADEETGNDYGLKYVLDKHGDIFGENDLFLVPDFGRPDSGMLEIAEKSMLWMQVRVNGVQTHASRPDQGRNSLVAAADMITRTGSLEDIFSDTDALFSPPRSTFNPTKMEANVPNINTIPGLDVFYIDCRILPRYDLRQVVAEIEGLASRVAEDHGVEIGCKPVHFEQAAPATDSRSNVVEKMRRAVRAVYSVEPEVQGVGGGTVALYLRKQGYPAVVWSTLMNQAHQANECSSVSNTINDARVFIETLTG
ncbi:MAG: M20 family metallo-hydrolase [Desulfonatronovibrionaceae bacterium]